jgi:hypothetical protein
MRRGCVRAIRCGMVILPYPQLPSSEHPRHFDVVQVRWALLVFVDVYRLSAGKKCLDVSVAVTYEGCVLGLVHSKLRPP